MVSWPPSFVVLRILTGFARHRRGGIRSQSAAGIHIAYCVPGTLKRLDPGHRKPKTGSYRSLVTRDQHRQNEQVHFHLMQGEIMFTIRRQWSAFLGIVFFFGCATLASAAG